ncbi:hypothetical protein NUW54_g12523 [Trametes sanguinea]|uniref:Uncharacterized protein n=1 Tax=Trametes sanguinea TaxID=158606 RepID=A0ACC1MX10_9APHY|nr:hypothetical protein NUW54_g12523 [Trametes sanguinea]
MVEQAIRAAWTPSVRSPITARLDHDSILQPVFSLPPPSSPITFAIPASPSAVVPDTPYHTTLSQPTFWEHLYAFLLKEFSHPSDAATAWEDFFCASKGNLSVSEIAKIRDAVGVIGMAGT